MAFIFPFLSALTTAYCAQKMKRSPIFWFVIGMCCPYWSIGILILFPLLERALRFFILKNTKKQGSTKKRADEPVTLDVTPSFDLDVEPKALKKLWYFLDIENTAIGPMSFQLFYQRWQEGRISATTHIWNETLSGWTPFKDVFPSAKTPS